MKLIFKRIIREVLVIIGCIAVGVMLEQIFWGGSLTTEGLLFGLRFVAPFFYAVYILSRIILGIIKKL